MSLELNATYTALRSLRHHQHHDPGEHELPERHETPDPARSNALKARFHGVRCRADHLWLSPGPLTSARVRGCGRLGRLHILVYEYFKTSPRGRGLGYEETRHGPAA